ncbi:MAG: ABC transporter substrate-binding protein [Thermomicrobiales bacterium]
MDNDPQSALGHVNRGIAAHRAANNDDAKRHFAQALLLEPSSELAWLWFSEVTDDPAEQRYCLGRARRINPDSAGKDRWGALSGIAEKVPHEINDIAHPPMPPSFTASQAAHHGIPRLHLPRAHRVRKIQPISPLASAPVIAKGKGPASRLWSWLALALIVAVVAAIAVFADSTFGQDEPTQFVAVVGPMSGPDSDVGVQMTRGARLSVNAYNLDRKGPKLGMLVFDDQNDPELAVQRANEIVADSRILVVIGHGTSDTSVAAAPIYQAAGIAAITGQATTDELDHIPDYFRTVFDNSTEGQLLTTYLQDVLQVKTISVIVGPGKYEESLYGAVSANFSMDGTVKNTWNLTTDNREASIQAIVDGIASDPDAGMIVLTLTTHDAHDVMLAVRRRGLNPRLFGGESLGNTSFAASFANEPEEAKTPGFFTEGMYSMSPLIYDSVSGDALAFDKAYADAYNAAPGWRSAKVYDAVTAGAAGIQNAALSGKKEDTESTRRLVGKQIHAINSPDVALRGLSGPLYFMPDGNSPQNFSVGRFASGILTSAPTQYRLVTNPSQYDVEAEIQSGRAVQIDSDLYRQYRVAYVGLEMIELRDLDMARQSYTADFFIYFRYVGDDAPLNVIFSNATSASQGLGEPLESSVGADGLHYRLFRVQGTFTEPMNFESYPWDQHELTIRLQNPLLTQADITYVPDIAILTTPQDDRLVSGFDNSRPFNRIPSWTVDEVNFTQVAVTSTADDYETAGLVQFSEFRAELGLGRDVFSFLIKNLLPLVLLALATYIALWFPAEQAGTRINFSFTALLAATVMLGAISNQIPNIGYTVAIEWGFYVYIGLAAVLVLLNIAVDRSYNAKQFARVRRLDIAIRVIYPMAIAGTILVYWMKYS